MTICFRTMPFVPGDTRYRPDLRLGHSDAAVRKVSAAVAWFEAMAGLPTTIAIGERETVRVYLSATPEVFPLIPIHACQ